MNQSEGNLHVKIRNLTDLEMWLITTTTWLHYQIQEPMPLLIPITLTKLITIHET